MIATAAAVAAAGSRDTGKIACVVRMYVHVHGEVLRSSFSVLRYSSYNERAAFGAAFWCTYLCEVLHLDYKVYVATNV